MMKTVLALALGVAAQDQLLGGGRDSGVCLMSAGYTWCASGSKCVRVWETACPDR